MIESPWAFVASLLLCAGLFPMLESHSNWRIFKALPAIVLTYLLVTFISVSGFWQQNPSIIETQKTILAWLLPALMFLLLVTCDLRAILALGPRILLAFACATASILLAFIAVFSAMQHWLPVDAWQTLASVSGGWIGGTANMVAVSQAINASPNAVANALLTDALCYAVWVLALFATVPLQARFNRTMKANLLTDKLPNQAVDPKLIETKSLDSGLILVWLGLALVVGKGARSLAELLPETAALSTSSWTMLLATIFGVLASFTPLRRTAGSMSIASALLAVVVATLAAGADFSGLANAPLFVLAGFSVLALHALMMLLAARLFRFDLAICGIASLSNIGGVASAPLLAAAYSPLLAPIGVLLAMLGYLVGTGGGIWLASLLKAMQS